ncbi:MAG: hypothetical protein J6U81_03210, partial [Bacteroidales bacterium]|nr:hypothetical protein [Bacteroidales bacterium]
VSEWFLAKDMIRQMNQDISNSLHMYTKRCLLGLSSQNYKKYKTIVDSRQGEIISYSAADKEYLTKLHNVAKYEDLRWESAHKLMGNKKEDKKSMLKKHHTDMVSWSELSERIQSYDCKVVDTTIRMYYKEMENN